MRFLPGILLLIAFCSACDSVAPVEVEEAVVVEAYLLVGDPLPEVRLSRAAALEETYRFDSLAIGGADVVVHRLAPDGAVAATFPYAETHGRGFYEPLEPEPVRPLARYRLVVNIEGRPQVTSETLAPQAIHLVAASADSIVYQQDQLVLAVNRTSYPGRQSAYVMTTEALEASPDNLTPVFRGFVENGPSEVEDFRISTSPIFTESSTEREQGGDVEVSLPWLAVPFYGAYVIRLNLLDDNLYDFRRTQSVQQGGGTFPPGEIPNVIDHVEGGTGVFGSMARVTHEVVVLRANGGQ